MKKNKKNKTNYDIDKIYKEMETELINKMYKTLTYHKKEESEEGFEWEQWQKAKLRDIRKFRRESKSIIRRATKSIKKLIPESIIESIERGAKSVTDWAKRNIQKIKGLINPEILIPSDRPEDPNFEPIFFKTDPKLRKETIDEALTIADDCEKAIYRCVNDAYRKTIVKVNMKQLEGVKTVDQAVKEALDEFKKSGISYITYSDGKRVPINVYARMALRTARHRAYLKAGGAKRKELGVSKIIVSKHDTSCPLCEPFQHKVLIDDVYSGGSREDGDEMLLSEAMERGLFHPNCEHDVATYFEGVNIIPEVEEKEEKGYNEDKDIKDFEYIQNNFKKGIWKDKINWDKQKKHMQSSAKEGKSYFYDWVDIENLYYKYKKTGYLEKDRFGKRGHTEKIDLPESEGLGVDVYTNKIVNAMTIHYSKSGVHLVPTYYER